MAVGGYVAGRFGAKKGSAMPVGAVRAPREAQFNKPALTDPGASADQAPLPPEAMLVLRSLRSGWLLVDPSDRVVDCSPGVEALRLAHDGEIEHASLKDAVRLARSGQLVDEDLVIPRGPLVEAQLDLRVRISTLTDELVLALIEDVTQARRIEDTRRDFVVNVSHELKTPVGGLRLLAEATEEASDDPEAVVRFARRMKTESVRLTNLVQEIVDFSRLQGSDALATAVPVNLEDCAERAVEETRLIAENRAIAITVQADEADHHVLGDASLLTTAARNLVNNAVNYSEASTRISVETYRDGDEVVLRVSDEGVGMNAEELQRIFERFYRVDPARSRQRGGTGLGLAIVKHVCAGHGGEVSVWSEPGVGSTFEMHLPALAVNPTAANPALHGDQVSRSMTDHRRETK